MISTVVLHMLNRKRRGRKAGIQRHSQKYHHIVGRHTTPHCASYTAAVYCCLDITHCSQQEGMNPLLIHKRPLGLFQFILDGTWCISGALVLSMCPDVLDLIELPQIPHVKSQMREICLAGCSTQRISGCSHQIVTPASSTTMQLKAIQNLDVMVIIFCHLFD